MKEITLKSGEKLNVCCNALTPRFYRQTFGRDMILDLSRLSAHYNANIEVMKKAAAHRAEILTKAAEENRELTEEERNTVESEKAVAELSRLTVDDLNMFENLAYAFAHSADKTIPEIETWLEGFSTFAIWEILPGIFAEWQQSNHQISVPAKN